MFFNFLGAYFIAPRSGQRCEKLYLGQVLEYQSKPKTAILISILTIKTKIKNTNPKKICKTQSLDLLVVVVLY